IDAEEADLRVLEENISKLKKVTTNIKESLTIVTRSAGNASSIIHPIAGEARDVRIYETNLKSCLNVLDEVRDYAKITTIEQQTIEGAINQVGLDVYMRSVRRLSDMVDELKQGNFTGFPMIMDEAKRLIVKGHDSLKDYYASVLLFSSKVLDTTQLIDGSSELLFDESTINSIQRLLKFFSVNKVNVDYIYIKARTEYFKSSLLKVHQASNPSNLPNDSKFNKNNIQVYSKSLKTLILVERTNLKLLFNNDNTPIMSIFRRVVEPPLNDFTKTISDLNSYVKKKIATESLLAFELIESLGIIILTVEKYFEAPESLDLAFASVRSTSETVFTAFMSYIDTRVNSSTSLQADNKPCEATIDIMSTMQQFAACKRSAATTISNMKPGSWIPTPRPAWCSVFSSALSDQGNTQDGEIELLSTYFSDTLDALLITLELKAKSFGKTTPQVGFCLLTNFTYIERCVKNSDICVILASTGGERFERLKKRAMNMFIDDWKITAARLMEATVLKPGKQSLSSKDREMIKEKFKIFNTEFELLVQKHKAYNISDPALKRALAKEVSFISPLYHRFHDKHVADGFAKNIDKYIKYDNNQFDKILESLG
ncbi:hypothetical protein NADFUDRAFT_9883, partial [Nadsonia fulvescens var. elongata DSM 6958]